MGAGQSIRKVSGIARFGPHSLSLLIEVTSYLTFSGTIMSISDRTNDRTSDRLGVRICDRPSDRKHLVTLCHFVSMFAKASRARRKRRHLNELRCNLQWRAAKESHKKSQFEPAAQARASLSLPAIDQLPAHIGPEHFRVLDV